ncbi:GMC family oxidoreductase [Parvularcula marina]|uniref:GMC family oxidoreductase n=1 Tax=Parvularcula marina TaxID=2292771 RepID=UPI00351691E7
MEPEFDAIVVGSGMSGGWAAKELTERGLKTLVIERGRHIEHGADYTDFDAPWELPFLNRIPEDEQSLYPFASQATKHFRMKAGDHPYSTPEDRPFRWFRGYHLGGRSLMWARQSYRMSDIDFEANKKDGYGVDWPIRYQDIAPWYDHVERFAGISGQAEGLEQLPDGVFQPAMELNCLEQEMKKRLEAAYPTRKLTIGRCAHITEATEEQLDLGRGNCQYRSYCSRGCSFGSYFSSLSATLPAARLTENLTIVTDAIGHSVIYDPETNRATGVRIIDSNTKEGRIYTGRVVFLCASAIGSAQIMLNSMSDAFPTGIANSSDMVGRNLMDHVSGMGAGGSFDGFEDMYYSGRRPNGFYIPRYRNVTEEAPDFVRGYGFQGGCQRGSWERGRGMAGIGADFKHALRTPSGWSVWLSGFGEMLPNPENRVTLHPTKTDQWGMAQVHIDCTLGENDKKLARQANLDAVAMLEAAGFKNVSARGEEPFAPGSAIHEMGTVRMGHDPKTSVLNKYNQAHDVPNLFVTDGACMTSTACQNPSLTYMAMSARAAHHAAEFLKAGAI